MPDSPATVKSISKYGFARFYYPGEENFHNNVWLRTIELDRSDTGNKKISLALSLNNLIPLSLEKKNKIIKQQNFAITAGDKRIPDINLLAKRAGWNQTLNDIKRMVDTDPQGCFNAIFKDGTTETSLGCGTVLRVAENIDWIGMILVHPELRRQGIALEIMKMCIAYSRLTKNTQLIGLDATPMGFKLYNSLGFKESFRIWRSTMSTDSRLSSFNYLVIKKMNSVEDIMNYLVEKSIDNKSKIFSLLLSLHKKGCFFAIKNNNVCGIILSRPGRLKPFIGPLIADSNEIAKALLQKAVDYWRKKGFSNVFLDIPEYNFIKKAQKVNNENGYLPPENCILANPVKPVRLFYRMYHLINENELKTDDMALGASASHYEVTKTYMKNEKEKLLPFLKCTGGPEMS
jgi:GNAT superfamily N-acetyltransferase